MSLTSCNMGDIKENKTKSEELKENTIQNEESATPQGTEATDEPTQQNQRGLP